LNKRPLDGAPRCWLDRKLPLHQFEDAPSERIKRYTQAQEILKQAVPYSPLAYATSYQAMSKNVQGYAISPVAGHRFEYVSVK